MKAVILAGGEGKRLRPLTHTKPKALLQVAGRPIIQHIISEIKKTSIQEIVIVVKYKKEKIIEYFRQNDPGIRITFAEQGPNEGTAAALLAAENKVDDDFLVIAGDIITEAAVIEKVLAEHRRGITLALKKVPNPHEYGVVELNAGFVSLVEEKVAHPKSDLANLSIYVMGVDVFDSIKKLRQSPRGEYELTDLLIAAKGVVTDGYWTDIGYPWHLFDANDYLLSKMPANSEKIENSTIKGKVVMEKGSEIFDSYIEGTSYIGGGTKIGPHSYLRGTNSIGKNCEIGESTTIKNSILFDNVKAKHLSYIGDSVIGDNVNFGAGTQIANYRFDSATINVHTEKGWVNSGRKKLGVIVGDNTKFGVLSCTMPGKLIGNDCWISSGVIVNRNVAPGSKVLSSQVIKSPARKPTN